MSYELLENVLGKVEAGELWTSGYRPVFPVIPANFSLGGLIPLILYMMRWGHRRGSGKFQQVFGEKKDSGKKSHPPTIGNVAEKLSQKEDDFQGFTSETERAVLSDLLLAFCLENKNHKIGRDQQVQRIFPTHYFASWLDLPTSTGNLRGVPEFMMTLLARQSDGKILRANQQNVPFPIRGTFQNNLLLSVFSLGTQIIGHPEALNSDCFCEKTKVGVDQILPIRLAQSLGEAPQKVKGENPDLINQLPLAGHSSKIFQEDLHLFLQAYAHRIPRQSLQLMLESGLALGLTTLYLSVFQILLDWSRNGAVPLIEDQQPWPLFVDCSVATDLRLRRLAEESIEDLLQRMMRYPVCLTALRILNQYARLEKIPGFPAPEPNPSAHINFLGDLLFERLDQRDVVRDMRRDLGRTCNKLKEVLSEASEVQACQSLDNEKVHPAWRLAESISFLMGSPVFSNFRKFFDSSMLMNEPHGIGRKRKAILKGKSTEQRSCVLSNTVLDYLVHRHLVPSMRSGIHRKLSVGKFIVILRERYGLFVDTVPPGMSIPQEDLHRNRLCLEKRLRDLGLFLGVNDAEAMKRLRPRYSCNPEIYAD